MATEQAKKLGLTLQDQDFARLGTMANLTPGDFAAVARRHRFAPFTQTNKWICVLQEECELKQRTSVRVIGF